MTWGVGVKAETVNEPWAVITGQGSVFQVKVKRSEKPWEGLPGEKREWLKWREGEEDWPEEEGWSFWRYERRGGKAGRRISEFSRGSRARMLRLVGRLAPGDKVKMMEFTYKDPVPPLRDVKRDLAQLLKALKWRYRRLNVKISGVWRLGTESRGVRRLHPHLHLIVFGMPYLRQKTLEGMWWRIAGKERGGWVWIGDVPRGRALGYVAKYVGKVEEGLSLEDILYLTGQGWIGRFWGVFNREGLPWGMVFKVMVGGYGEWLTELWRLGREVWHALGRLWVEPGRMMVEGERVEVEGFWVDAYEKFGPVGFTLFIPEGDSVKRWVEEARKLAVEEGVAVW